MRYWNDIKKVINDKREALNKILTTG